MVWKYCIAGFCAQVTVYARARAGSGPGGARVRLAGGYWRLPQLGPAITRDRWGLRILSNLEPGEEMGQGGPGKLQRTNQPYHYSWPYTDNNTGESVASWVKQ